MDSNLETVINKKISCEKSQIKQLKEKSVFYIVNFFSVVQVPKLMPLKGTLRKISGQNISLRIPIRIRI
jgi:hypothetical protein